MEPEDQRRRPDDQPKKTPPRIDASSQGPHSGSEEAGLHEKPGSGVAMPGWAQSLQQDAPASQSDLKVDLVERMRQEEAAAAARAKAAQEAAERARQEAEARARAAAAARKQAARHQPPARKAKRRISKWPSALAALVVILVGGYAGMAYQRADQETPSPESSVSPGETPGSSPDPAVTDPLASPGGDLSTYTVQPGDTLESIAKRFGETPAEVSRVNGGNKRPLELRSGQVINIP